MNEDRPSHLQNVTEDAELFRMLIEMSGDPIFMIDDEDDCRMIYVNEAAVKHFGAPREEILAWRIPDWDPNFSYEKLPEHVEQVKNIKNLFIESVHRVKSGELVPVEITLNAVNYKGRLCHFGYFKNISERKKAEASLVRARDEAEAANRSKSQFLASMSHELRTPMNAMLGFAQLLEYNSAAPLTDKQKEYVRHIITAGEHLRDLIDEVLDLAKIDSGKMTVNMEPVDVCKSVDAAIYLVKKMAKDRDIIIENMCKCEGLMIRADGTRFKQVLLNLLSNAVKYNRPGGTVHIWSELSSDAHVRVCVEDTGSGLTPEKISRVFEPFNRLGAEGGNIPGTGIGLTITKKLVETMDAKIWLESEPGKGSRFYVEFNRA
ncbi:MAG: PAS domain-containing sensor histidine kinase [Nitrospirota bacterium]|nr:PAS domain-containing sensor histidine kinase [Nitrospirota bacterium]